MPWRTMYTVTVTFYGLHTYVEGSVMAWIVGKYMFAVNEICTYIYQ